MNLRAHQELCITLFIRLLVKAAHLYIGEYDAKNYDEYQIIVDHLTEY